MMIFRILLLFGGAIAAFWISAICGGGASLILIPVLNLLMPASFVPFSLTIGTFTSAASRITVFRKYINWNIFLWFVPFSLPAVLLGAYLIKFVNPLYLQLMVAIFLVLNTPQLFKSSREELKEGKPFPKYVLAVVGFLAGFVSGVTGAIGLLFNRFYLKYGLSKEQIVATRAANEIVLHLIKLIIYLSLGLYSQTAIWMGITIALAAVASAYSVKFILPYLSEFLFKKIGYGAMVFSGLFLLVNTSEKIINTDNIHITNLNGVDKNETTFRWRQSDFVLEYAFDEGFEIEKAIAFEELPAELKRRYNEMLLRYDKILLEKVCKFRKPDIYEFYCYQNNHLTKLEFDNVPE